MFIKNLLFIMAQVFSSLRKEGQGCDGGNRASKFKGETPPGGYILSKNFTFPPILFMFPIFFFFLISVFFCLGFSSLPLLFSTS